MSALYAYAVVPATLELTEAPPGIDAGRVALVAAGSLAALVSPLDEAAYDPDTVAARSRDVEWLGARAAAHDRVITWASDRGPVIPLPLFALFRDAGSVRGMLGERGAELGRTLAAVTGAREYTVRVFRVDTELAGTIGAHSPEVAHLESRAASASPGQRYLLDRKLEQVRRTEIDRLAHQVAESVFMSLTGIARHSVRDPVTMGVAAAPSAAQAVLNASFLVDTAAADAFRAAVTHAIEQHGALGFRFEFTGPWAPYHFVRHGGPVIGGGISSPAGVDG